MEAVFIAIYEMKSVIVSACYAIIAALISKRYLIFWSVSEDKGTFFGVAYLIYL